MSTSGQRCTRVNSNAEHFSSPRVRTEAQLARTIDEGRYDTDRPGGLSTRSCRDVGLHRFGGERGKRGEAFESSGERGQSEKRESDRLPDRLTRATGGRLLVSVPTPWPLLCSARLTSSIVRVASRRATPRGGHDVASARDAERWAAERRERARATPLGTGRETIPPSLLALPKREERRRRRWFGRRHPSAKLRPNDQHPTPPAGSLLLGICPTSRATTLLRRFRPSLSPYLSFPFDSTPLQLDPTTIANRQPAVSLPTLGLRSRRVPSFDLLDHSTFPFLAFRSLPRRRNLTDSPLPATTSTLMVVAAAAAPAVAATEAMVVVAVTVVVAAVGDEGGGGGRGGGSGGGGGVVVVADRTCLFPLAVPSFPRAILSPRPTAGPFHQILLFSPVQLVSFATDGLPILPFLPFLPFHPFLPEPREPSREPICARTSNQEGWYDIMVWYAVSSHGSCHFFFREGAIADRDCYPLPIPLPLSLSLVSHTTFRILPSYRAIARFTKYCPLDDSLMKMNTGPSTVEKSFTWVQGRLVPVEHPRLKTRLLSPNTTMLDTTGRLESGNPSASRSSISQHLHALILPPPFPDSSRTRALCRFPDFRSASNGTDSTERIDEGG